MGFLKNLFGGASTTNVVAPPPMAMPPSLADPSLRSKGAAGRANAMANSGSGAALVKPATTTQTSLLGG